MLIVAAILLVALALAHSLLGERFILRRLFKRDNLPQLFGSDHFTKATLRFAWHLTSLAWLGFAALLLLVPSTALLWTSTVLFARSGALAGWYSQGRHLSWLVFLAISGCTLYTAAGGL